MAHLRRFHDEMRAKRSAMYVWLTVTVDMLCLCGLKNSSGRSGSVRGFSGHASLGAFRNSGPANHYDVWTKSDAERPRETWSAAFSSELTYLHCEGLETSIFVSLFATNTEKRVLVLFNINNTDIESVQKIDVCCCRNSNSEQRKLSICAARVAAINSNLGIETVFSGANLTLA